MSNPYVSWTLTVAALLPGAAAQGVLVSPPFATSVDGRGGHPIPWSWSSAMHYMQIHSDLSGAPRMLKKLAFRQDRGTAVYTGVRTIELEAWLGHARSFAAPALAFSANYVAPRFQVVTRKVINMGPQGAALQPGPSPFQAMDLSFDVPFAYDGVRSFAWEVAIHANSLGSGTWNHADAEAGGTWSALDGVATGVGCDAIGQPAPMLLYLSGGQGGSTLYLAFQLTCAPSDAPTVLALGGHNPSLTVPGLCSPLGTDLQLLLPVGNTDSLGEIARGGAGSLILPSPGAGTLYAQYHSLEPLRADPIKVCNSNGLAFTLPAPGSDGGVRVTRLYAHSPNAALATHENGGLVNACLVTQFTF